MTSQDLYTAWRVHEKNGGYEGAEEICSISDLPENDVLIRVTHSSLNYKDALSASGNKGVTRSFPHTPGIDAAGEVVESRQGPAPGQQVIVTGYDLGMNTPRFRTIHPGCGLVRAHAAGLGCPQSNGIRYRGPDSGALRGKAAENGRCSRAGKGGGHGRQRLGGQRGS
ncbi:MAG: alcohol dehydrogenase catalytic domain-containing protein [Desulfosalsimonas sp.]|uniref:alcohol dehydrogenase catalytic domain-containing protein n=1 Tax=Desulfosalsimonas sp. TaxID=3073848 RepID=UPI003970A374